MVPSVSSKVVELFGQLIRKTEDLVKPLLGRFYLMVLYIFLTRMIGSFHPFEPYDMYNCFPNAAFYFHFADEKDILIPLDNLTAPFRLNGGFISHMHSSMRIRENLPFFIDEETEQDRKKAGELMFSQLQPFFEKEKLKALGRDSLNFVKVCIYLENDSIKERSVVLFSKSVEELLVQ